ncbi:DUF2875 family protein, partial [Pseudomonas ficuserectae]|uniref:type VI lipase adapter Tla3 domain-containing protein n=1 Tax=Pseudomonas ficuserectae TaxID=53410 RepID=UPI000EFEA28B
MNARKWQTLLRPRLRPYVWAVVILLTLWGGFVLLVYFKAQERNMELRDINSVTRWGIAAIVSAVLLTYSGHWWGKAIAQEQNELAAYKTERMAQASEQQLTQKRTYALEIRGVGLGIYHDHQSEIWEFIKKKNNNFISIYSKDPKYLLK